MESKVQDKHICPSVSILYKSSEIYPLDGLSRVMINPSFKEIRQLQHTSRRVVENNIGVKKTLVIFIYDKDIDYNDTTMKSLVHEIRHHMIDVWFLCSDKSEYRKLPFYIRHHAWDNEFS